MLSEHRVMESIRSQLDDMFPAERKVAEYILTHPESAAQINITELADLSGTSDATVIRMCKRLGYTGFYQLKLCLSTELGYIQLMGQTPKAAGHMQLPEILRMLARNVITMEQSLNEDALNAAVNVILNSRHIYLVAAGNSIPNVLDFGFRLSRLGIRNTCHPVIESILNDIALSVSGETLIVLSHSGSSKAVVRAVELAKSRGLTTIILTHSSRNAAALMADYCLLTYPATPLFHDYGIASHLFDTVVIDVILYMIACRQSGREVPDQVELLLSEFKL